MILAVQIDIWNSDTFLQNPQSENVVVKKENLGCCFPLATSVVVYVYKLISINMHKLHVCTNYLEIPWSSVPLFSSINLMGGEVTVCGV
jgi:hypothetical protein